jgi:SAM-dependent methyltransferase
MKNYKQEYYEQSRLWDPHSLQNPADQVRIQEIISVMPSDVHSVLDVGCGNGTFVNALLNTFSDKLNRVAALDSANEALKYVTSQKIRGSITELPFANETFDLVSCLEVLEHLPHVDFNKGLLELQRVTRKYIMVTVPNDQDLHRSLVMCPECHCWFNPYFHMRGFNKNSLRDLFQSLKPKMIKEIGPIKKLSSYDPLLLFLYRTYAKPRIPETTICPQCGYQHKENFKYLPNSNKTPVCLFFRVLFLVKPLVRLVSTIKKKKSWLLALYEKTDS